MLNDKLIQTVILPETGPNFRYYKIHVQYVRSILDFIGVPYILEGSVNEGEVQCNRGTKFLLKIDDKKIVVDFSDHTDYLVNWSSFDAYFKFHYTSSVHSGLRTIYPFSPVSFYDWDQYQKLLSVIKYTCNSDFVINMQSPGGNATERRQLVQRMLKDKYGDNAHTHHAIQVAYWTKINDCLVHVFVPGARNDMLDRGHMQYLAFGCCTIAPPIVDELPYGKKVIPGIHYVECRADYSNLVEKIEWCKENRGKCIYIGKNAQKLFEETSTPQKLWQWVLEKI